MTTMGSLLTYALLLYLCLLCCCRSRQASVLARKRREYLDMVPEFYDIENDQRTEEEVGALRQVRPSSSASSFSNISWTIHLTHVLRKQYVLLMQASMS
jgi:hypothetical protein